MTVYVVIREDQNEYGYIDAGVVGVFEKRADADSLVEASLRDARSNGLVVCGDAGDPADWNVSWSVEAHPLSQSGIRSGDT